MILLNVSSKTALTWALEDQILKIANVASIVRVEVIFSFLITQLGERIYDNTEDNVQANDIYDDLETRIMHQLEQVLLRFVIEMHRLGDVANSSTIS